MLPCQTTTSDRSSGAAEFTTRMDEISIISLRHSIYISPSECLEGLDHCVERGGGESYAVSLVMINSALYNIDHWSTRGRFSTHGSLFGLARNPSVTVCEGHLSSLIGCLSSERQTKHTNICICVDHPKWSNGPVIQPVNVNQYELCQASTCHAYPYTAPVHRKQMLPPEK